MKPNLPLIHRGDYHGKRNTRCGVRRPKRITYRWVMVTCRKCEWLKRKGE